MITGIRHTAYGIRSTAKLQNCPFKIVCGSRDIMNTTRLQGSVGEGPVTEAKNSYMATCFPSNSAISNGLVTSLRYDGEYVS